MAMIHVHQGTKNIDSIRNVSGKCHGMPYNSFCFVLHRATDLLRAYPKTDKEVLAASTILNGQEVFGQVPRLLKQ